MHLKLEYDPRQNKNDRSTGMGLEEGVFHAPEI